MRTLALIAFVALGCGNIDLRDELLVDTEPVTHAEFNVTDDWVNGYCGMVTIRNLGDTTVTSWSVTLDVGTAEVGKVWGGTVIRAGQFVTVLSPEYTQPIPPDSIDTSVGLCAKTPGEPDRARVVTYTMEARP